MKSARNLRKFQNYSALAKSNEGLFTFPNRRVFLTQRQEARVDL